MRKPGKTYRLKNVTIRGYKSIAYDEPLTMEFSRTTLLIGANGAGKSNIVSFFRMLSYMMSGTLQLFVERMGTNRSFLYYGPKRTPQLEAALEVTNDAMVYRYLFRLVPAAPDRLIFGSEHVEGERVGSSRTTNYPVDLYFKESALLESNHKQVDIVRRILSYCKVYQFHDSSASGPLRQASLVNSAQYLQSEGNNLGSFLYFLRGNHPDSYQRIVAYVRTVVPQFKDFYLEPVNNYVSLCWVDQTLNDYVFTADQFSDGSIRFIALATLLLQPALTMPSVIIIDEPELGLHPCAIEQLTEMIKDASLHSQVIVATQSPALLDGFDVEDIRIVERDEESERTVLRTLDREALASWMEHYTLSELWDKNVIGGRPE